MSLIHTLKNTGSGGGGSGTVTSVSALDTSIAVTGTATDPVIGIGIAAARLIPTANKTGAYTAAPGEYVMADSTSGAVPIQLPTAPADKTQVGGKHVIQGGINGASLVCGGSDTINKVGGATTYPLPLLAQAVVLQYKASNGVWYAIASDYGLPTIDARYGLALSAALAGGDETTARELATSNTGPSTSTSMRLTYFTARRSETTTQVRTFSGTNAAGATPTLCRIGLYLIDASDNATLVASTANDTALWAATNTAYVRSWSTPYAKIAGQRYALGLLVVTGATAPSWPSTLSVASGLTAEMAQLPRLGGVLPTQSDLPGSFLNASVTSSAIRYYGVILP